ncbi:N-acetylmuramidase domain-containing protein [Echinicola shivajiensis]|uniref:N-acetylmuramidase domain-containing protein n=1 Tax=Echinicola shivajiensis TaxID=1035916 RepID=UPI001BFCAC12|nr:N-acetylmuramidase family protein [Echinicola shivajiensis]
MQTLRYRSRGPEVQYLEEILSGLGYDIIVSNYFDMKTHEAVMDFQKKNDLVVDGIVGIKTWTKILAKNPTVLGQHSKLLSEKDLINFAEEYGLELAAVKAVNEVESSGKGFLPDGRAKILFEGHIFWRQLKKQGIAPSNYANEETKDVLYSKWTRSHYKGGAGEYIRLQKAVEINHNSAFKEAAYKSASWGAFQIMGYHCDSLGYPSIDDFVAKMQLHEREHLKAFGKFLAVNNLIQHLKVKNWAQFARGYNGPGYAQNKYDVKMQKAYEKYS